MDKRIRENIRVRKSIEEALFTLLKTKKLSEISVTDIVKVSGVARSSYYRNFDSKESIIESYIQRMHDEVREKIHFSENMDELLIYDNLVASLEFYLKQKFYLLQLYNNGLGMLIQEELNRFSEDLFGNMPQNSIHRYKLYFLSGAMLNMTMEWLKSGAMESPREMATEFLNYLDATSIE